MRNWILLLTVFSGVFTLVSQSLYAFENQRTHPAITERAAVASTIDDYLKTQMGSIGGINTQLYYNFPYEIQVRINRANWNGGNTQRPALDWLKLGSAIEDTDLYPIHPIRPRHHFYDPTRNAGLNNKDDNPDWTGWPEIAMGLVGSSALVWAVNGTALQNPTTNNQSWQSSRTDFYNSLTKPLKNDREKYLAMAFLDLGCVLHMVEDMGVPAHTRNDFLFAHYRSIYTRDYGNPLEMWAEGQVTAAGNNIPSNWLTGWTPTPKVFNKVSNYFDTDTRNANSYLGDGILPPDSWGLSESTNYQFLSWSTIFIYDINSLYYFPHPDIDRCDVKNESGRTYLYGYGVNHLAKFTMSEDFLEHGHLEQAWCTLGEAIYNDYVRITIPRTIDYATGLVNYFFRGRLNVEPNWTDPNIVKLVITNDSNNSGIPQMLAGGTFEIYWDDVNDTRTKIDPNNITFIPAWTPASTLPNDGGVTELSAQFAPPAEAVKKYIVVYRGDICENPADPDLDDPNAIAVTIITCGYEIAAWAIDPGTGDKYGQVSNVPEGSDFVDVAAGKRHCLAIRSDGSLVGWGYNNYGECDVPAGTDYIAIAAGVNHSIALKSDGSIVVWGRDNLWQITDKPSGNDFIAITAGDYHSLALKTDGTIVGWGGWNDFGECDAPAPDPGTVFTAISAGKYQSLALQSDGVVKAWGSNNQGQTRIYDGADNEIHIAIAACDYYNTLMRDDGMLISWGGDDWLYPDIPRYHYRYPDGTDFAAIAAGWDHILALTSDGEILSWYWPEGDYPFDYFFRDVPEGVVFTDGIAAGYDFSLSLKAP